MKKKDYLIINFFLLIFMVVLYQRKIKPMMGSGKGSSSSSGSGSGSAAATKSATPPGFAGHEAEEINNSFSQSIEALTGVKDPNPKKGTPPAGMFQKSFYDEKGNFKSYYEGKLPDEFLTKSEYFTDPNKMLDDIYYKKSKMHWHQEAEREEYKKFHDWRGKDRREYQKLLDDHARAQHEANDKNHETWKQLKRDYYQYDSELR